MLALTRATHDIAAGRYDVEIPELRGSDEISLLSGRFRRMVAQLAEAEQLKRSFLMSVSHELRTPLTAIRGHVEALREGIVTEPEAVQGSLDVIAAETDRLERLVGDVLDLAKLQAHRFTVRQEEVDLGRVLDHAYGAFAEEARRRAIDYRLASDADVEADATVIVSDGDRVLQVISNLLSNAFRWTPDGGKVELGLAAANGVVSVDVVDSGPGIPAAEQERIFDAFISHDVNGTGLGLPIAKELALALGGRIEVQSDLGRGSRFRLVLPAVARGAALGATRRPRAARSRWRPRYSVRTAAPRSSRSRRASTPRQPELTSSTSSARSSTRACRSASNSPSRRSSRRIAWLRRPRISAMWRATGSTSVRSPSRTATPTWAGIEASRSAAVAASVSICARERSSAASSNAAFGRPAAASAIRCLARSRASSSMGAEATLSAGWTPRTSSTTSPRS